MGSIRLILSVIGLSLLLACTVNKLPSNDSSRCPQFDVDIFNNIYSLTTYGVSKIGTDQAYNNPRLGEPKQLDIGNGQNILLFYKSSQRIVFLDSQLNEIHIFDLRELGVYDVSAICYTEDEELFLYGNQWRSFIEMNREGEIRKSSNDLYAENIDLTGMQDMEYHDEKLFIRTSQNMYIYSKYGELLQTVSEKRDMEISDTGEMYYINQNALYKYEPLMPQDQFVIKVEEQPCRYKIRRDRMITFDGQKLTQTTFDED